MDIVLNAPYAVRCPHRRKDGTVERLVTIGSVKVCWLCIYQMGNSKKFLEVNAKVQEEYGMTFEEAVLDMRKSDPPMAWRTIAHVLGMSYNTFQKWAIELGVKDVDRSIAPKPKPLDQKARNLGFANIGSFIADRRASGFTYKEMAKEIGCHRSMICKYGAELNLPLEISDRERARRRQWMHDFNESRRKNNLNHAHNNAKAMDDRIKRAAVK